MISTLRRLLLTQGAKAGIVLLISLIFSCLFNKELGAQGTRLDDNTLSEVNELLHRKLDEREALIWHLSHCGYALRTKSALLIFDYWEKGRDGKTEDNPPLYSLANGRINPDEIEGLTVYVFVTHAHADHYDQVIFGWEKTVKRISYIFGWPAKETPAYHYLTGPRSELDIGGLEISTINETHDGLSGVCYLVKIDGLCFYFSGDYGWAMLDSYKDDFEYLATKTDSIDVAFLDPCYYQKDSDLVKLEIPAYFIQKFSPRVVFPRHYGGREELLARLVDRTRADFPRLKFVSPKTRGEGWHLNLR